MSTLRNCFFCRGAPVARLLLLILLLGVAGVRAAGQEQAIIVGSKNFNESYLLAEIMSQVLEINGFDVERKFGLAGTLVCFEALVNSEIDLYAEYTGTVSHVILKIRDRAPTIEKLNSLLAASRVKMLDSFGFNNTYAISLKAHLARSRGLTRISQLKDIQGLNFAFSMEFLNREDGWPGLNKIYQIGGMPTGIDHGLAYRAIDEGKIDITDAYSTDGDLERYDLIVLEDDKGYFPQYFAAPLLRADLPPGAISALSALAGRIDDNRMRMLNGEVIVNGKSFAEVAQKFLENEGLGRTQIASDEIWQRLKINTIRHLQLTAIALGLGCLFGLSIGIAVFRSQSIARMVVYLAGLLQTIPSLALLALMIPLFGIGMKPAVIALFLYSILPILRNTITALITIDPILKRVAEAMGLTRLQQLRFVLLPLAMPNIFSGIKTAAVICIGTATLAAYVGAGGLGEPIITGLQLNDTNLILQGAIPAAGLAIVVELLFEAIERLVVKPHMREGRLPD